MSLVHDVHNIIDKLFEITSWKHLNISGKAKSHAAVLCERKLLFNFVVPPIY
jgi:hypothetical protein